MSKSIVLRKFQILLMVAFLNLPGFRTRAEGIDAIWSSARVLPLGRTTTAIRYAYREIDGRYGLNGQEETLGDSYYDIRSVEGGVLEREYAVAMTEKSYSLQWEHGLTRTVSIGVVVPFQQRVVALETESRLMGADGLVQSYSTSEVRRSFGLDPQVSAESESKLGNVELTARWQVANERGFRLAVVPSVRFPSADAGATDVVASPLAEASGFGAGMHLVNEADLFAGTAIVAMLGQTWNFKDQTFLRGEEPSLIDGYSREPGDKFQAGIFARQDLPKMFQLRAGVQHQQIGAAAVSQEFPDKENTKSSTLNLAKVGMRYGGEGFYKKYLHGFDWSAQLDYSRPFGGKNIGAGDEYSLGLSVAY